MHRYCCRRCARTVAAVAALVTASFVTLVTPDRFAASSQLSGARVRFWSHAGASPVHVHIRGDAPIPRPESFITEHVASGAGRAVECCPSDAGNCKCSPLAAADHACTLRLNGSVGTLQDVGGLLGDSENALNACVGAMPWTRARIQAFQSRVMTRVVAVPSNHRVPAGNVTVLLHSLFPGHTQHGAYAVDEQFSDTAVLAELGLLLTPFYLFSDSIAVQIDQSSPDASQNSPDASAAACTEAVPQAWAGSNRDAQQHGSPRPCSGLSKKAQFSLENASIPKIVRAVVEAGNEAAGPTVWGSWTSLARTTAVRFISAPARDRGIPSGTQRANSRLVALPAAGVEAWLHRNVESAFSTMEDPVFHDLGRLQESLAKQRQYSRVLQSLRARSNRGVRDALAGTAAAQPIPHVLTAFNVIVDPRGHLYSSTRLSGSFPVHRAGGVLRTRTPGGGANITVQTTFRPTMCLHDSSLPQHAVLGAGLTEHVHFVEEVVVLTQHWGDGVFHFWRECLPRLLLMLDYVKAYKHVRIHVSQSRRNDFLGRGSRPGRLLREPLEFLGINPARIITGHVHGHIVHVPEGTPCGNPYVISDLLAREVWRRAAGLPLVVDLWHRREQHRSRDVTMEYAARPERELPAGSLPSSAKRNMAEALHQCYSAQGSPNVGVQPQGGTGSTLTEMPHVPDLPQVNATTRRPRSCPLRVVIIERAPGARHVKNHAALAMALGSISGVAVDIFTAHRVPSVNDTIHMFAGADVIVAPHGAGLTNLLFSSPGQVVIELLAREPQTNLVFARQSLALGLRYHAFVPAQARTDGAIVAEVDRVAALVAALAAAWPHRK